MAATKKPASSNEPHGVDEILRRQGGLSYMEIPATDPAKSAKFYKAVLGWIARDKESGEPKFADPAGHLIGRWITGRPVSKPGFMLFFYVNDVEKAAKKVVPNNGQIVKAPHPEGDLLIAVVKDPAGNTLGLWQAVDE
jgi:uncharacterized protein